jgi:hypothetical protein
MISKSTLRRRFAGWILADIFVNTLSIHDHIFFPRTDRSKPTRGCLRQWPSTSGTRQAPDRWTCTHGSEALRHFPPTFGFAWLCQQNSDEILRNWLYQTWVHWWKQAKGSNWFNVNSNDLYRYVYEDTSMLLNSIGKKGFEIWFLNVSSFLVRSSGGFRGGARVAGNLQTSVIKTQYLAKKFCYFEIHSCLTGCPQGLS